MKSKDNTPIKIAIIEDTERWVTLIQRVLEPQISTGLIEIVSIARSVEEALDTLIPTLEKLCVQYILLDGDLGDKLPGLDGKNLAREIKKNAPKVKTIGFSSSKQDYVDIPMGKYKFRNEISKILLGKSS